MVNQALRITVNDNISEVDVNDDEFNAIGEIDIPRSILLQLKTLFLEDIDENIDVKQECYNRIVTLAYENNINFNSMIEFATLVEVDFEYAKNIYREYGEYHYVNDTYDILSTQGHKKRYNYNYYVTFERKIINMFYLCDVTTHPRYQITKTQEIVLREDKGYIAKISKKGAKNAFLDEEKLLLFYPIKIVEIRNPEFIDDVPLFEMSYIVEGELPVTLPPKTLKELEIFCNERALSLNRAATYTGLVGAIGALKIASKDDNKKKLYELRYKELCRGVHYINGELKLYDYELKNVSDEQLREGIQTLLDYSTWFNDTEKQFIGTCFKWGLFSPFMYAYKQAGRFAEWLYLQGTGGTGKSVGYGKMISHMWFDRPTEKFEQSVGTAGTVAQLGAAVNIDTFPIIIQETENVFEADTKQCQANAQFLKVLVERTEVRHTQGQNSHYEFGYSGAICTSNGAFNDSSGGGNRRLIRMNFTRNEIKLGDHAERFNKVYHMQSSDCILNKLQYISHIFMKVMLDNPEYMGEDWKKITDDILQDIFNRVDCVLPSWLSGWVEDDEGLVETFEDVTQLVKDGFQKIINGARKNIQVMDEYGHKFNLDKYDSELDGAVKDPMDYVEVVLKSNMIEGMYLKNGEVHITQSILNRLYKDKVIEHRTTLKNFAQNYGWIHDNKNRRLDGKQTKSIFLPYDNFINWCYSDFS